MAHCLKNEAWRNLRVLALDVYGSVCMKCGGLPHDSVMQVDHIKPKSKYPDLTYKFNNLQILCSDCNIKKAASDIVDYRNDGQIIAADKIANDIGSYLDIEELAQQDIVVDEVPKKSLAYHIRSKLNLSVPEYCDLTGDTSSALYYSWRTEKGRRNIESNVIRVGLEKLLDGF